jgi:hypothetical protein
MNTILVVSSFQFLLVSIYAFCVCEVGLCVTSMCIFTASTCHHMTNVNRSMFHRLDLLTSRVGGIIYLRAGLQRLPYDTQLYFMVNSIICTYLLSLCVAKVFVDKPYWKYVHVNFHTVVCVSECIVVSSSSPKHVTMLSNNEGDNTNNVLFYGILGLCMYLQYKFKF